MKQRCSFLKDDGEQCKNAALFDGACWRHSRQTCAICMNPTSAKRTAKTHRLTCGHAFHKRCITEWLVTSETCPVCRVPQDSDPMVRFKRKVEARVTSAYQDAISSLERQNAELRRMASSYAFFPGI